MQLLDLEEKWTQKYPVVIESWKRNWEELSQYFQYNQPIRKIDRIPLDLDISSSAGTP